MITNVQHGIVTGKCKSCGRVNNHSIVGLTSKFVEEFNQFENLKFFCESENCKSMEIVNMNIPTDEMSELKLELEAMPFSEINQRYYVRRLIELVREDFQNTNILGGK